MSMLVRLKGIGPETAAVLWSEGLFRRFDNRRQAAADAGLAPTPWQSGSIDHEQGVSKAANPRLRATMVELAWLWLQNQPTSRLSLWFHERVQRLGGRMRKTIIVALARKLLKARHRFVFAGHSQFALVILSADPLARSFGGAFIAPVTPNPIPGDRNEHISFLTWSIADACDWFVHLPVLGFLGLLVLPLLVLGVISMVIETDAGAQERRRRQFAAAPLADADWNRASAAGSAMRAGRQW